MDEESDFHSNTPGIRSWIFVFVAAIACVFIFVVASPQHDLSLFSFGSDELAEDENVSEEKIDKKKRKRKKRKGKKSRRKRKKGKSKSPRIITDEELENDYVYNDLEFGEVGREEDEEEKVAAKRTPLPPPPKSLWNPSSSYRPNAVYAESGRTKNIVSSVDFEGGGGKKGISPSTIRSKLTTSVVLGCYNNAVNRAPKMRGRVKVKGTIERDGHISYVKITSSELKSRTVEKCIVKKLRAVRFSRAGQATKFSTSFSFSSH